jgi:hypothetical protein
MPGPRSNPKPDDPNGPQTPRPAPAPDKPKIPEVVRKNAEKFGYNIVQGPNGLVMKDPRVGYHKKSDDEIKFLQHAANKYDVATPGIADFKNAQYINGNWFHLTTGQGNYDGNAVLTDDQLAVARARAGWTPEVGMAHALDEYNRMQKQLGNPGSGELPAYLATPEGYQAQLDYQRASLTGAGSTSAAPSTEGTYQPFTQMTQEQSGVPGYPLTTYADYGSAMTAAQGMLANHYASAAAAGDFTSANTAFTQLQAHNELTQSAAPAPVYSGPESFSEADLYDKPQTQ